MGTLYLVGTPIGNMEDITLRAIRILATVDFIACEDTRKTGLLLHKHKIKSEQKLLSYYEGQEEKKIPIILQLINEGKNVALVSNAGTPLVSDPGFKLVKACLDRKIRVESIPGPSAVITALILSGLPTDKFLFLGYLPKKISKRQKIWEQVKKMKVSTVIYESPYRLLKTLEEIQTAFGDIQIAVCRELTKLHEEVRREEVSEAIKNFKAVRPRGEFTLVIFQG